MLVLSRGKSRAIGQEQGSRCGACVQARDPPHLFRSGGSRSSSIFGGRQSAYTQQLINIRGGRFCLQWQEADERFEESIELCLLTKVYSANGRCSRTRTSMAVRQTFFCCEIVLEAPTGPQKPPPQHHRLLENGGELDIY